MDKAKILFFNRIFIYGAIVDLLVNCNHLNGDYIKLTLICDKSNDAIYVYVDHLPLVKQMKNILTIGSNILVEGHIAAIKSFAQQCIIADKIYIK